jgi:hypothetical protein
MDSEPSGAENMAFVLLIEGHLVYALAVKHGLALEFERWFKF